MASLAPGTHNFDKTRVGFRKGKTQPNCIIKTETISLLHPVDKTEIDARQST